MTVGAITRSHNPRQNASKILAIPGLAGIAATTYAAGIAIVILTSFAGIAIGTVTITASSHAFAVRTRAPHRAGVIVAQVSSLMEDGQ